MEFVDLNIYYSFTKKNPDRDDCVKKFSGKPKQIVLKQPADEQTFNQKNYPYKFVYILF